MQAPLKRMRLYKDATVHLTEAGTGELAGALCPTICFLPQRNRTNHRLVVFLLESTVAH